MVIAKKIQNDLIQHFERSKCFKLAIYWLYKQLNVHKTNSNAILNIIKSLIINNYKAFGKLLKYNG